MMNDSKKMNAVKSDLKACTQVLAAIGDETRQLIMVALIDAGCDGLRVGEITAQTQCFETREEVTKCINKPSE